VVRVYHNPTKLHYLSMAFVAHITLDTFYCGIWAE